MSARRLGVWTIVVVFAAAGCSESTRIRTSPPNARVYVDNRLIGIAPIDYVTSRDDFQKPHTARAELDGYAPAEEPLRTTLAVGRLIGAIFTLGLVYAFRSPYAFRNTHDLILEKLPDASQPASAQPARATGPSVEDRLQRIKQLREKGVISQEEYERYELEILRGQ